MQHPLAKLPNFISTPSYINPRTIPQHSKEPSSLQTNSTATKVRKGTGGFTDQEIQIATLKKENFSLKLRLFYLTSAADTVGGSSSTSTSTSTPIPASDSNRDTISKLLKNCAELKYLLSMYQTRDEPLETLNADQTIQNDPVKKARLDFASVNHEERGLNRGDCGDCGDRGEMKPDSRSLCTNLLAKTLQATAIPSVQQPLHSLVKESVNPIPFEKEMKNLQEDREILICQLKKARHVLKKTLGDQRGRTQKEILLKKKLEFLGIENKERKHKCLAFIAQQVREMSLELDSVTWSIYKRF